MKKLLETLENLNEAKIRFSPLPANQVWDINSYVKSLPNKKIDKTVADAVYKKFVTKKWQIGNPLSISTKYGEADFYGKKNRDLGRDHMNVTVYGNKYVAIVFTPSNSNTFQRKYYGISGA